MDKKLQNIYLVYTQFIDTTRFMASSLSNIVKKSSKGIHKIKCKYRHNDKNCKTCGFAYEVGDCFLDYKDFKDNLIEYKCLCCNKNYQTKVF